jgi:hypothetical protein
MEYNNLALEAIIDTRLVDFRQFLKSILKQKSSLWPHGEIKVFIETVVLVMEVVVLEQRLRS